MSGQQAKRIGRLEPVAFLLLLACATRGILGARMVPQQQGEPWREIEDGKPDFDDADDPNGVHSHWALLVAGSNSWWNYRHQADVSHAYQVLRRGGFKASRIVTMMYDDIATNHENPKPGKVFNRPGGPDVYKGGHFIDYRGDDVNAANVLAVLEGNRSAVKGIGTGKVISSGPNDRVFVFYSDHGSPGVLGMPTGDFLYADQLVATIKRKRAAGGFKEMTLYIEACESGSIFEGLLPEDLGVYATTAANSMESSWGTYCPGMDPEPADGFDTCLGDLYSVAWMEDCEWEDLTKETLEEQFEYVRARTSNNYTYSMGSHVMAFGDTGMQRERAGDYMGTKNTGYPPEPLAPAVDIVSQQGQQQQQSRQSLAGGLIERLFGGGLLASKLARSWGQGMPEQAGEGGADIREGVQRLGKPRPGHKHAAVEQRDADLAPLRAKVARAKDEAARQKAQAALDKALARRAAIDSAAHEAAAWLLSHTDVGPLLMRNLGWEAAQVLQGAPGAENGAGRSSPRAAHAWVQQLVTGSMGRPAPGVPLVDSWDCLRGMVRAWQDACGSDPTDMDRQYAMKHTRLFANLCNAGLSEDALAEVLEHTGCGSAQQTAAATAAA